MARVIAIYNQAGGVAKTTTTRDLGYELVILGFRVLLIDADFQGSLGSYLGCRPHSRSKPELFWTPLCHDTDEMPPVVEVFGLGVGMANLTLAKEENLLVQQRNPLKLFVALKAFQETYDYILIDCPPHLSEVTVQALIAADEILVPTQTEEKAVVGLDLIQEEIIDSNKRRMFVRPPLRLTGILPTLYDGRLTLHRHYLAEIQAAAARLECLAFSPIRKAIAVAEACNYRQPLKLYEPKCQVNQDIGLLATQISQTEHTHEQKEVLATN